jgi:hypothetical protein
MADDNTARNRTNDPYSHGPASAGPASDPLAELARLIGQSDPFSEVKREARSPAQNPPPNFGAPPAPAYPANPAPQYAEPPQYAPEPPRYAPEPVPPRYAPEPSAPAYNPPPRFSQPPAPPQRHAESPPPRQDWPGAPPAPSFARDFDPFDLPPQRAPQFGGHQEPAFTEPPPRELGFPPRLPGFDAPFPQPQAPHPGYAQQALYPDEPEAGSMPPPHDDEYYDDEAPRGGRRRGLATVIAVFGLAVLGTAGAFGYRSLFGGPTVSGPPPVIRASSEPAKVAPPPQSTDQSASKFSYDRFGDAGKDERVVQREEKPVDITRQTSSQPRSVFPGAPAAPTAAAKPGSAMAYANSPNANPPSALGEPRKVRTVPIRPDQADVAANSPVASSDTVSAAPSRQIFPPPQRQAAAPNPAPSSAAAVARPTRVASRPAPAAPEPPAANAPLSLAPDANSNFPPPPTSVPAPAAPQRAAAPARVASAPASGGSGSFLVQVTSQRSEADAQSSYSSIQQKYASVLGSQPHVIRKADLGTKGVYYRAMVGPFGSREEAVQLCSSLKQAGGDCVVQH